MNGHLKSPQASPHLTDAEMQLLLSDDDASDSFRSAAAHIETCGACQSKLTASAGDPDLWNDAQAMLSTGDQPRWQPDLSQCESFVPEVAVHRESVDDRVLKLLGVPKHPEMLGRLGRYDIEKKIGRASCR